MSESVCPCPETPVNYWRRHGRWTVRPLPPLSPFGVAVAEVAADMDGDEFNAGGYDMWVIACPSCGRIYAAGDTHE